MIVAVIPALDEAATIGGIVARLRGKVGVIVVDDASTDGTADHARLAGAIHVVCHSRQRGKAAALRTGFAEALRHGATGVVTLDGDGQHDPDDQSVRLAPGSTRPTGASAASSGGRSPTASAGTGSIRPRCCGTSRSGARASSSRPRSSSRRPVLADRSSGYRFGASTFAAGAADSGH